MQVPILRELAELREGYVTLLSRHRRPRDRDGRRDLDLSNTDPVIEQRVQLPRLIFEHNRRVANIMADRDMI